MEYNNSVFHEYNVSRETFSDLQTYVKQLHKWNESINLIGKSTEDITWERHVIDSIQLTKFLDKNHKVLDIGSGAGIPGLILAILGFEVTLVEKNYKKTLFLEKIKSLLRLKVVIINDRLENICFEDQPYQITSRGFSKIVNILEMTEDMYNKNCKYILPKGRTGASEIKEALKRYRFSYEEFNSITNSESNIIIISKNG